MGGCRCSYKNCKSATKTSENLHFFHYPVKHTERCKKWIENACKPNFFDLAEEQLRNKVVCELHFESRCFTNIQRKRLLHDAIPTLDVGCEEEKRTHYSSQFDNVQILPASSDGTLFTVDTDSMQMVPESTKVESYIYKNGTLVPLYKNEAYSSGEVVCDQDIGSARRTIQDRGDVLSEEGSQEARGNYHIIYNDFASSINARHGKLISKNVEKPSDTDSQKTSDSMEIDSMETKGNKDHRQSRKNLVRHLKRQSRDIASIKSILKSSVVRKPVNRSSVVRYLNQYLPPSLSSVVKYNIYNNKSNMFIEADFEFFKDIYSTSPQVFNLLREKYHWSMPEPVEFQKAEPN